MKLCKILLLVVVCDVLQHPIFCSQERARQLALDKNKINEIYSLQVNIQILGEQFYSLAEVLSEIPGRAENEGYHWEPSYIVDQRYNQAALEQSLSHADVNRQEDYDLMTDVQKVGVEVVKFLIWGLRD